MAVVDVRELFNRRGNENAKGHRTYVRVFRVQTDDPEDDSLVATAPLVALGLVRGTSYVTPSSTDTGALLSEIDAQCTEEDGLTWEITLSWTTDQEVTSSPLLEDPEYTWEFNGKEVPMDVDLDGKPCVNKAGLPFLTPITRFASDPILKVTRNQANFPFTDFLFRDCINSDLFLGYFPPGTARYMPPSVQFVPDNTWGDYYKVGRQFAIDPDGWEKPVLNAGVWELRDGKYRAILGADGLPVTEPQLLDNNGKALPPGSAKSAIPLWFRRYNKVPFNPILA